MIEPALGGFAGIDVLESSLRRGLPSRIWNPALRIV
jgi:hypothetical protein